MGQQQLGHDCTLSDDYASVREVATLLQTWPRQVRRAIHSGRLQARRDGDRWMVHIHDLAEYVVETGIAIGGDT
jgi:excisionase family DNA binding protein